MREDSRLLVAGFAAALLAAVFFAGLGFAVMHGDTASFDLAVRNAIHEQSSPMLTRAMQGLTQLGSQTFLIPLGALLAWRLWTVGRPRAAVLFAIAAAGGTLCDQILKYGFRRPRPEAFFGLAQPTTYSFPSGHSVESCCFYGVLAAILSVTAVSRTAKAAIWSIAAGITLAIGFSRIYLGVHYPTDVLGGYAVAIVWVAVVRAGYRVWLRRRTLPPIS